MAINTNFNQFVIKEDASMAFTQFSSSPAGGGNALRAGLSSAINTKAAEERRGGLYTLIWSQDGVFDRDTLLKR